MKIISYLFSAAVCILFAYSIYYFINHFMIDEGVVARFVGILNEDTKKYVINWNDISISAKSLDYSSYAFGIVSLPVAAVSVYLALASESLEKIGEAIFEKNIAQYGDKQSLIDFCKEERKEKDKNGYLVEARRSELNVVALQNFYADGAGSLAKLQSFWKAYGLSLFLFVGRAEAFLLFIYTLIIIVFYFSMPFFYYTKSALILHLLFFIYLSSLFVCFITLLFFYKRNRIIKYWEREIPVWLKNASDSKAAREPKKAQDGIDAFQKATGATPTILPAVGLVQSAPEVTPQ